MDSEGNIRLGDFGLATRRREKPNITVDEESAEVTAIYDAIEDISGLLGSAPNSVTRHSMLSIGEGMTGGVGTTFYRAPEQEGSATRTKGEGGYNMQADMYSLGVIIFEMLHPPFATYMERSETLRRLRGEQHHHLGDANQQLACSIDDEQQGRDEQPTQEEHVWKLRHERFPESFVEKTSENAQRIILCCLASNPSKRPTASELLKVSKSMMNSSSLVWMGTHITSYRVISCQEKLKWNSITSRRLYSCSHTHNPRDTFNFWKPFSSVSQQILSN